MKNQNPKIENVDLTNQDRKIRTRFPRLEIIHEKMVRSLRTHISSRFGKLANFKLISTDFLRYGEFVNTLPVPNYISIMNSTTFRHKFLVAYDNDLVCGLINTLMGGEAKSIKDSKTHDFTPVDMGVMREIEDLVALSLNHSWAEARGIGAVYEKTETNPHFINITPFSEVVIATTFEMEMGDLKGTITIVLPYPMLEPVADLLSSSQADLNPNRVPLGEVANRTIRGIEVELEVKLGSQKITLANLNDLSVGSVISLNKYTGEKLDIFVGGKLIGHGEVVSQNERYAIRITDLKEDK